MAQEFIQLWDSIQKCTEEQLIAMEDEIVAYYFSTEDLDEMGMLSDTIDKLHRLKAKIGTSENGVS